MIGKSWIFITLTALGALGGGFYFGAYPDHWHQVLNPRPTRVKLLVEDRSLFPKELQIWLFERTGQKVEVYQANTFESFMAQTPSADLVMGRMSWLMQLTPQFDSWTDDFEVVKKISPDFLSDQLTRSTLLPMLWQLETLWPLRQKRVKIIGMAKPKNSPLAFYDLHFIIDELLTQRAHEILLLKTPLSSCLHSINYSNFEDSRKPAAFRDLNLRKLELY